MRRVVAVFLCAIFMACGAGHSEGRHSTIIPWAWERREDLRFAQAERVAYLAATLELTGDSVHIRRRMQPLYVRAGTPVIPVIRIETDRRTPAVLSQRQVESAAAAITELPSVLHAGEVQIDFDAVQSQRDFYRALLGQVRSRIGPDRRLSITALASWCMDDPWLAGLPIDDAIPMLFEMGRDAPLVRSRLAGGKDFRLDVCRHSVGISTAEPLINVPPGRTVWVFSRTAWSPQEWQKAKEQIGTWKQDRSE